jgi:hypothetical protein
MEDLLHVVVLNGGWRAEGLLLMMNQKFDSSSSGSGIADAHLVGL